MYVPLSAFIFVPSEYINAGDPLTPEGFLTIKAMFASAEAPTVAASVSVLYAKGSDITAPEESYTLRVVES
jgi:hypothetical protein